MKQIEFCVDYPGFNGCIFVIDKPKGWDSANDVEKSEWAKATFWDEFSWSWGESLTGVIEFCADYFGFSGVLFVVDKPEDWESMDNIEKGEWAAETFWGEFGWSWGEVES